MHLRFGVFVVIAAVCIASAVAQANIDDVEATPTYHLDQGFVRNEPRSLNAEPQLFEADADEPVLHREARSISQQDLHRPEVVRPTPSPTFPRPPSLQARFRRDVGTNEADLLSSLTVDEEDTPLRVVRTLQPYQYPPRFPGGTGPTIPRPEDILARHPQHRFRRQSGRVSVDVEKNSGQRTTTRVTADTNVYKSGDGRTRLDVGGYATDRGDRGGNINFSHRF